MATDYNPLTALQSQGLAAVQNFKASCGVGLLSLATGAVSAFMVKTDRLSCANFRRLIGVTGLVALAALYCGIKAYRQATELSEAHRWTQEKQGIFNCTFEAATVSILGSSDVTTARLFQDTADRGAVTSIEEALIQRQGLAPNLPSVNVSAALRSLFRGHRITGKDLTSGQQEQVRNFFTALRKTTGASLGQYEDAWPGVLPQTRASASNAKEISRNSPWVLVGGVFDLSCPSTMTPEQRERLYNTTTGRT
jgi:hypothetical protein